MSDLERLKARRRVPVPTDRAAATRGVAGGLPADRLLALQRTRGNAAVGRALQRQRAASPRAAQRAGSGAAFAFRVGAELPVGLARAARRLARDAPLAPTQLRRLQRVARGHGPGRDTQLMFLAGLLDGDNVRALSRMPLVAGAGIEFSLASISAGMPQVKALVRRPRRQSPAPVRRRAVSRLLEDPPAPDSEPAPAVPEPAPLIDAEALEQRITQILAPWLAVITPEWDSLGALQRSIGDGALEDYAVVRDNLLAAFGAANDGKEAALARVRRFYADEMEMGHLLNKSALVHKRMAKALKKADEKYKKMTKGNPKAAAFQLTELGGLNIRPNKNRPEELSEHAVGAAVDLDAYVNPNERGFPFEFITDVTGKDLRAGATGKGVDLYNVVATRKKAERLISYEEALAEAKQIRGISDDYKAAFQNELTLVDRMAVIVQRAGGARVTTYALADAVEKAANESTRRWAPEPKPAAGKHGKAGKKPANRMPLNQALADLIFPAGGDQARMIRTVEALKEMYRTFSASVVAEDPKRLKGKQPRAQPRAEKDVFNRPRVDPQAVDPSDAQLAFHGFMNVPPELAAALVAHDGGNLRWLGAGGAALRDFMHFELRDPPKPPKK